jgi:hypothetical protein
MLLDKPTNLVNIGVSRVHRLDNVIVIRLNLVLSLRVVVQEDEIQANNNDIIKPVYSANTYVNKISGLIEQHAAELDVTKATIEK